MPSARKCANLGVKLFLKNLQTEKVQINSNLHVKQDKLIIFIVSLSEWLAKKHPQTERLNFCVYMYYSLLGILLVCMLTDGYIMIF